MLAEFAEGKPEIKEPDKMVEWAWFSWDKLPRPLFIPMQNLLKTGFHPFREKAPPQPGRFFTH